MFLIIVLIVIIILLTEVRFKIVNIIDDTSVYIKIGIIKIYIDYDTFMATINNVRTKAKFTFNDFKKGLGYYNIIKNIVNESSVEINNFNITKSNNNFNITNVYLNISYYTLYTFVKNYLITNTKSQQNISFVIIPSDKNDIDFNFDFKFSLILFLKSCLFNFKNIIKIKKEMV